MIRRFRKAVKPFNLWIDAICLDQTNKKEIEQQVLQIGDIFHEARKVRVWMGDEDEDVAKVFAFFQTLTICCRESLIQNSASISQYVRSILGSESILSIQRFLHRPWFTRRWVIQEMALARVITVRCHDQQISWNILSKALETFVEIRKAHGQLKALPLDAKAEYALASFRSFTEPRMTLLENLLKYHEAECAQPQDKIFALLGISNDMSSLTPADNTPEPFHFVDYSASADEIFCRLAAKCVERDLIHRILYHVVEFGSLSLRVPSTPSWCPDWTQRRRIIRPEDVSPIDQAEHNVLIPKNGQFKLSHDGRRIFLRLPVVEVLNSTEAWSGSPTWTNIGDSLHKLLFKDIDLNCLARTASICLEVLYGTC
jgi:heterokaryon incompatibility protein (HET)